VGDVGVEAGGGFAFGGVGCLAAGQFDAEFECLEDAAAAFELIDRQLLVAGEGVQGCADVASGAGFGVSGPSVDVLLKPTPSR
jgi:hypothetical protein